MISLPTTLNRLANAVTPTQLEVLKRMDASGEPIERRTGGFWTLASVPSANPGAPEWYVDIRTVRALERMGLLERTGRFSEEWRDPRRINRSNLLPSAPLEHSGERGDMLGHQCHRNAVLDGFCKHALKGGK